MEIREAIPTDAAELLSYVNERLPELNIASDEFRIKTWAGEYNEINNFHNSPNSLFVAAFLDGKVIGTCTLTGDGMRHGEDRAARKHIALLGISIHPDHRGEGIGSKLLAFAVDLAKETTVISRIEATNYEDNPRARWFLINSGFMTEGIQRQGIRKDGKLMDLHTLSRLI